MPCEHMFLRERASNNNPGVSGQEGSIIFSVHSHSGTPVETSSSLYQTVPHMYMRRAPLEALATSSAMPMLDAYNVTDFARCAKPQGVTGGEGQEWTQGVDREWAWHTLPSSITAAPPPCPGCRESRGRSRARTPCRRQSLCVCVGRGHGLGGFGGEERFTMRCRSSVPTPHTP